MIEYTLLHKLEKLEVIVHAMANALLYVGRRQENMSIVSDALTQLENQVAALQAEAVNAANAFAAAAQAATEAQSNAQRVQVLQESLNKVTADLAALKPPA